VASARISSSSSNSEAGCCGVAPLGWHPSVSAGIAQASITINAAPTAGLSHLKMTFNDD